MASRLVLDRISVRTIQGYHHKVFNLFTDQENLVDAIGNRPGFLGSNPLAALSLCARRWVYQVDLDDTILNDKFLIRAPGFRNLLMLFRPSDYMIYYRAIGNLLRQKAMEHLLPFGIKESTLYRLERRLEEEVWKLPKTTYEISKILEKSLKMKLSENISQIIIRKLNEYGILIRGQSKGWKGNEFNYYLASYWLPEMSLSLDNPESARIEVIRRYLMAYGPASVEDMAWWTGFSHQQVIRAVTNLKRDCARFFIDGSKEELFGLRDSADDLIKKPTESNRPILFLPPLDPFVLGWYHRGRIISDKWQPYVYDARGNAASVILQEGRIVGLWQFKESMFGQLEYCLFEEGLKTSKLFQKELERQVHSLTKMSGCNSVDCLPVLLPRENLMERSGGSFLWPLLKPGEGQQTNEVSIMERRTSIERSAE